jgi:hypothetical protein
MEGIYMQSSQVIVIAEESFLVSNADVALVTYSVFNGDKQ